MKSLYVGLLVCMTFLTANAALAAGPEEIYGSVCSTCHETGVADAPKLGDKEDWAPRIALGKEALYKIALEGKPGTMMIAKGGSRGLSDAEVKSVVDFMIEHAQ